MFQSQARSPGQSIPRRITDKPYDKLEGFQSQFQRDPSTTTSAVQIRKRAAIDQAEERTAQRAQIRQTANQEFQRQD
ncbi:hypothetical protein N7537_008960 [Penicillium hordei]|uniref:Uncharacterized protein n=1 Tax=Penicillium hordei TaxID=40994 RepID=A0AAD6E2N6_9EURO|nr:uncharacterized protein N7537_008960 [Penicillium hordei]KAJ5598876.1 hypothetical protein N7537_008960 [Penicillium hordei]